MSGPARQGQAGEVAVKRSAGRDLVPARLHHSASDLRTGNTLRRCHRPQRSRILVVSDIAAVHLAWLDLRSTEPEPCEWLLRLRGHAGWDGSDGCFPATR